MIERIKVTILGKRDTEIKCKEVYKYKNKLYLYDKLGFINIIYAFCLGLLLSWIIFG